MSSDSHDEFIELCALSTSDSLTPAEWQLLEAHLESCSSCRELKAQYERIAFHEMPALASELTKADEDSAASAWSVEQAEERLMAEINSRAKLALPKKSDSSYSWRSVAMGFAAAWLLLAGGLGVYQIYVRLERSSPSAPSSAIHLDPIPTSVQKADSSDKDIGQYQEDIAQLHTELNRRLAELEQLQREKSNLEEHLKQRASELEDSARRRAAAEQKEIATESGLQELQVKLDAISSRKLQETAQLTAVEGEVSALRNTIEEKNREVAEDEDLLKYDRDIRDLIAARDLYIVDVHDTKKSGTFQQPLGRVFYTKDKSLIFYGYDLDKQPGLQNASTFQVWGTTRANDNSISLGLFYHDDTKKDRWILKYNDSKTIAQLDRIFVTAEPQGGSNQPTSKPILMTSLRIDPNHP